MLDFFGLFLDTLGFALEAVGVLFDRVFWIEIDRLPVDHGFDRSGCWANPGHGFSNRLIPNLVVRECGFDLGPTHILIAKLANRR